jgi:hypothetical protein
MLKPETNAASKVAILLRNWIVAVNPEGRRKQLQNN